MNNDFELLGDENRDAPTRWIVSQLVEILGSRLCAVIGNVGTTGIIREWVEGVTPTDGRTRILRFALRVAKSIVKRHGSLVAQSWFLGANQRLTGQAPALILKRASAAGEVEATSAERKVIQALRELLDM